MPHTSHKKKASNCKREQVDQDGWTRVTHKPKPSRTEALWLTKPDNSHSTEPARLFDPFSNVSVLTAKPENTSKIPSHYVDPDKSLVPPGMTLDHLKTEFSKTEDKWLTSDSWNVVRDTIEKYVLDEVRVDHQIKSCVLLGTGTMCGIKDGWITRHEVAILQTVVFKSIVDAIYQFQSVDHHTYPVCYAQDPVYNNLDTEFLAKLNIQTVNDPKAFEKITTNSFVYAPGAELAVDMRTIFRKPALFLTSELDWYWRNEKGVATTDRIRHGGLDLSAPIEDFANDPLLGYQNENNCRILEEFKANHESIKIPNFDAKDYPFYQQYLYYHHVKVPPTPQPAPVDLTISKVNDTKSSQPLPEPRLYRTNN